MVNNTTSTNSYGERCTWTTIEPPLPHPWKWSICFSYQVSMLPFTNVLFYVPHTHTNWQIMRVGKFPTRIITTTGPGWMTPSHDALLPSRPLPSPCSSSCGQSSASYKHHQRSRAWDESVIIIFIVKQFMPIPFEELQDRSHHHCMLAKEGFLNVHSTRSPTKA